MLTALCLLLVSVSCRAQDGGGGARGGGGGTEALRRWSAGAAVSLREVEEFGGVDSCFSAVAVPDGVWERMQGGSYRPNKFVGRSDLRHVRVLHYDLDGTVRVGEMVCNRLIATVLVEVFRLLFDARYPIQSMLLPDEFGADDEAQMRANNSSCFCYRAVSGSAALSRHAMGLAVDINPLYNPYVKVLPGGKRRIQPATAAAYCDRAAVFPCKIDESDLAYRLLTARGFVWGGSWRSVKDYQHFEWRGR